MENDPGHYPIHLYLTVYVESEDYPPDLDVLIEDIKYAIDCFDYGQSQDCDLTYRD